MRKLVVCNIMSLDGCFEAPSTATLPLIEARRLEGSQNLLVRYEFPIA